MQPPFERPRRAGFAIAAAFVASTLAGGAFGSFAAWQLATPPVAAPNAGTPAPSSTATLAAASSSTAAAVYQQVGTSVVEISVSAGRASGNGSGFVVDQSGSILTNYHVVEGARAITVRFSTGETRQAQVVGTDRGNDLALLEVDALPFGVSVATLGDSDQVRVGDVAIAIGSPFGLEQTVTQGIISAVDRTYSPRTGSARRALLQTDAPINPGNSGGPLLNERGEVIGINSMIESPIEGSVGIGFAVSINVAKQLLPQLQSGAQLEPVWLGISGLALDGSTAAELGLGVDEGVYVLGVVANGPASRAGVRGASATVTDETARGGDVIVAIDGVAVGGVPALARQVAGRKPGDVVRLTIVRANERLEIRVTLEAWPAEASG